MSTLLSAVLAPDSGATVLSGVVVLRPGEAVNYSIAHTAGATQDVALQKSSGGVGWENIAEAEGLDSSGEDLSGKYTNSTGNIELLRFRSTETNGSSTDEQATVGLTSVADTVPGGSLYSSGGALLVESTDEFIRQYVPFYIGYTGSANARVASGAASQSMSRLIFGLGHTGAYGFYTRSYITAAAISADAARIYATVEDVAAATVRGLHCSLSQGATGSVTGLGVAAEFTLHLKDESGAGGTISPIKAAIHSDGDDSDPVGSALSYIQIVNQGSATGGADVDDDAVLFHIQGHTIADDNMVDSAATAFDGSDFTHGIKIKVGGTTMWLVASTTNPKST